MRMMALDGRKRRKAIEEDRREREIHEVKARYLGIKEACTLSRSRVENVSLSNR